VARLLLARNAAVDQPTNDGWTPLCAAAQEGHEAVAQLLLERNAAVAQPTPDGYSPLYIAAQNGHEAVARLLRRGMLKAAGR
jgi:ankyrin repeat protein